MFQAILLSAALVSAGDSVVLMGDSQAFLLGWEFPRLADASGVVFHTVSVPGSSVISWSIKGPWDKIRSHRPRVVFVSLGSNDACTGVRVIANEGPFLDRFVRRLERLRARVVWLAPPAIGDATVLAQARPGQDAFMALLSHNNGFLSHKDWLILDARPHNFPLWGDKLHCSRPQFHGDTANGCRRWAEWVWSFATVGD